MNAYTLAKQRYAALGADTEAVLNTLKNVTVSVHCWQRCTEKPSSCHRERTESRPSTARSGAAEKAGLPDNPYSRRGSRS